MLELGAHRAGAINLSSQRGHGSLVALHGVDEDTPILALQDDGVGQSITDGHMNLPLAYCADLCFYKGGSISFLLFVMFTFRLVRQ